MGYIITGILVIIGIIVFSRFSQTATNQTTNTPTKKPSNKHTEFKRGKDGSYDKSWFVDENGKFRFPRYKSSKDSLVKIKDMTEYKDIWGNMDSYQKKNYDIKMFEYDIDSYGIMIEIDGFYEFWDKLKSKHLKSYNFKNFNKDDFIDFIESEKEKYIIPDEFTDLLYFNSLLSLYSFKYENEKQEYFIKYLNHLNVKQLKDLSKKRGLKTTLKKQELINQIVNYNDFSDIPLPYILNDKTKEFINHFLSLYLIDIKNQIDSYHPLYIKEIWDMVDRESGIDEYCKEFENPDYKKIYESKYWEERMYIDNI